MLPSRILHGLSLAAVVALSACGSVSMVPQSASPAYTSAYAVDDRAIGSHDLDVLTRSKQRGAFMMHFDRPADEVFEFLLTRVDEYSESVVAVAFDHSSSTTPGSFGVGSVRICTFDNGKVLREPLTVYEPHRYYAYTVDSENSTFSIPLRDVLLFYSFEERGTDGTLVTVRAHHTPKIWLATPVITGAFNRDVAKTFAGAVEAFGGTLVQPDA